MMQSNRIPELAGVATYAQAARVGYSVEENVQRLLRLHWTERRLMETMWAHIASTPVWEVKCALALHQWYCAEHADWLRSRIKEMRHPAPPLDEPPTSELDSFLEEVLRSQNAAELVAGIYGVALPALRDAYHNHIQNTNPLVDHPTRRFMRFVLLEISEAIEWGDEALLVLAQDKTGAEAVRSWREHLEAYLDAATGIAGDPRVLIQEGNASRGVTIRTLEPPLPSPRATRPFVPDFEPRRDERFRGLYNFEFPPHVVYNAADVAADERNLALLCKRTLEMDVPEVMASFLFERKDQPWEFYLDYSRQLWDEVRHAMMGSVAFESRGVDWTEIPLNVGFSLRLNLHASAQERQILLFAIEQSLMPGETGKRFEYQTAVAAGDELSAHFHDYDWADEVLHAQIGRSALKREGISRDEAIKRGQEIHDRTWKDLDRYKSREPQTNWWPDFVERVLGKRSRVTEQLLPSPRIVGK
ncbi:MAG TPA: hypothetical protein VK494_04155 [Gemmatimonadaceae bacterium]|jgi:hypothetical protein|nr:hypothetical protein [Gemmatimonadaceae bacterium]